MNCKSGYSKHITALSALFIMGNAVLVFPTSDTDEYGLLGYLIASAAAFALYFAAAPTALYFFKKADTEKRAIRTALLFVYPLTALLCLWCLALTFSDFISFCGKIFLPNTPCLLTVLLFLSVCIAFALTNCEATFKFSLLAFWAVLIPSVLLFFALSEDYSIRNIFIFSRPEPIPVLNQTVACLVNPVLPSLLLTVYSTLLFGDCKQAAVLRGFATGYTLLGLCMLSSLLLFGTEYAAALDYPYSQAVSTASGRLFARPDGICYFIYFVCALVKITVCAQIMLMCLKKTAGLFVKVRR